MKQIWNRLQTLFGQGTGLVVGQSSLQAKILDSEVLPNINRVEPYGFSSMPVDGCQPYIIFPSGDRSYGVALVVGDKRFQMSLQAGEVALHDNAGNSVHLKQGGVIEVTATTQVVVNSPACELTGNVTIDGNTIISGSLTVGGNAVVNGHLTSH